MEQDRRQFTDHYKYLQEQMVNKYMQVASDPLAPKEDKVFAKAQLVKLQEGLLAAGERQAARDGQSCDAASDPLFLHVGIAWNVVAP